MKHAEVRSTTQRLLLSSPNFNKIVLSEIRVQESTASIIHLLCSVKKTSNEASGVYAYHLSSVNVLGCIY